MEIVQASTDKQYDDLCAWLGTYTDGTRGKIENKQGNLTFNIYGEQITAYSDLKKFEINGKDKENIKFIKASLEYLINPRRFDLTASEGDIER